MRPRLLCSSAVYLFKRRLILIGLASMTLLLPSCSGTQSSLDPAGPGAGRISTLWWVMLAVCTAVFMLVIAALLYAVVVARRRDSVTSGGETEQRMIKTVSGATVATCLILFGLLVTSVFTGRALSSKPDERALNIEVTGHQWWWEVQYSNAEASRTLKTANEIHIPVGQMVVLKLTSHDVIHSFWVPNLAGKKDLIPGHTAILFIQADRTGVFRGQCAEFCGHQHAHMALVVVADPADQFSRWYESQLRSAPPPSDATQTKGQQVFLNSRCVMCHTIRGTTAAASVGPDLTHIASRQTIAAGTLPNTPDHLGDWILDSQSVKPGNKMPPNELSDDDLQALLGYFATLK